MNGTIRGYAMSPEELLWLQDVYMSVGEDYDQQKTSYILQFLWRDLTSEFDVIVPYFTCANSWDHKFLLECVMSTIQAFTLYDFHVRVLACDRASSNLALIKLLCGYKQEQLPLADGDDPFLCQHPLIIHMKTAKIRECLLSFAHHTSFITLNLNINICFQLIYIIG